MPPMSFRGVVTKCGFMNKTATVTVTRQVLHKKSGKLIDRTKKFLTHDEANAMRQDDLVIIRHCRPMSKLKRFELDRIVASPEGERVVARAKMAERAAALAASGGGGARDAGLSAWGSAAPAARKDVGAGDAAASEVVAQSAAVDAGETSRTAA